MKRICLTYIILSVVINAFAQNPPQKNSVYFELGGNGLLASINYERQVTGANAPWIGVYAGAGIYGSNPTYLTIPFGINYLAKLTNSESYIDIGMGATYSKAEVNLYVIVDRKDPNYINKNYWNYLLRIGFRRQTKKNLMYRISFTPIWNQVGVIPFLGASIGKSF